MGGGVARRLSRRTQTCRLAYVLEGRWMGRRASERSDDNGDEKRSEREPVAWATRGNTLFPLSVIPFTATQALSPTASQLINSFISPFTRTIACV